MAALATIGFSGSIFGPSVTGWMIDVCSEYHDELSNQHACMMFMTFVFFSFYLLDTLNETREKKQVYPNGRF